MFFPVKISTCEPVGGRIRKYDLQGTCELKNECEQGKYFVSNEVGCKADGDYCGVISGVNKVYDQGACKTSESCFDASAMYAINNTNHLRIFGLFAPTLYIAFAVSVMFLIRYIWRRNISRIS